MIATVSADEDVCLQAIGFFVGLGLARAGTRLVESFLYGVKPNDPLAFAAAALLLTAVTLVANYLPAREASRIDPLLAIRQ